MLVSIALHSVPDTIAMAMVFLGARLSPRTTALTMPLDTHGKLIWCAPFPSPGIFNLTGQEGNLYNQVTGGAGWRW